MKAPVLLKISRCSRTAIITFLLFFVVPSFAQPTPYMGTGMILKEKKGKWFYTYGYLGSLANAQLPAPGKKGLQILEIHDGFTGKTVVLSMRKSLDDLLEVLVGPEGSELQITLKSSGKPKIYTVKRNFLQNQMPAYEYVMSTDEEKAYVKKHFPYNYTDFTRPKNRDKDSLTDEEDRCPDDYGSVASGGCPQDTDGDGVLDTRDSCIYEFGLPEKNGCPDDDIDGDGIKDEDDLCMYKSGIKNGVGCPDDNDIESYANQDNDELPDEIDPCPSEWGSAYNKGCPVKAKTEVDINGFWNSYTETLMGLAKDPEKLRGNYIDNAFGFRVFAAKKPIPFINGNDQYLLVDSQNHQQHLMILHRSPDYKNALSYFSSVANSLQALDYFSTDTMVFSSSHQDLMYEPDYPEEYFNIVQNLIEYDELGEELNTFYIRIQLYRYEKDGRIVNEVRLFAEL